MRYLSTRGTDAPLSFAEVTLAGLAEDGGLYLPEAIPEFLPAEIASLSGLPYPELAARVIAPFVGDSVPHATLRAMLQESYAVFRHPDVAPLTRIGQGEFLLELFHGPTLAFKDFALQFLGRLLDYLLKKRGERVTVLGATSGDTGSAAIAGLAGRANMEIFILHPHGRVSDVQRRQMTTVADANVHNLAVEGTFDDCQTIVKALFGDAAFRREKKLTAINSINWARIVAQIPYYFLAALALGAPAQRVNFSVPTGNFGDIYAGFIARRMGLPVEKLTIASNANDILTRTLKTGVYGMEGVTPTLSPSMDIEVSSNFERLLFDLSGRDAPAVNTMMAALTRDKKMTLPPEMWHAFRQTFDAARVDDAQTLATMAELYRITGQMVDPHTAVGIAAGRACRQDKETPLVVLATAHPAKFPDAVKRATGVAPALPEHLADLMQRHERFDVLPNDAAAVKRYITAL